MARDKNKNQNEEQSNPEESLLEKRIDQMMDPKVVEPKATPVPSLPALDTNTPPTPVIDIFKDTRTAPKVSPELLKQIGVEDTPELKETPQKPELEAVGEVAEVKETPEIPVEEPVNVKTDRDEEEVAPVEEISDEEPFDDEETDRAVDEIAAEEGDKILETEDSETAEAPLIKKPKTKRKLNLKKLLKSKKFWIVFAILLIALFAVPLTRYKVLGLVYKPEVTLTVVDSETNTPVTNAEVVLHGSKGKTDGSGVAKIKAKVGEGELKITKQYYKTHTQKHFIGLSSKQKDKIRMKATGRQVPVQILNSITGEPIKDAEIKVLSSISKTDKNGKTTIVLPASDKKQSAEISSPNFNTKKTELVITERADNRNIFNITPTGKLYFLSNLSGKMDVVKSDLDGANRQVVVEGTGREDERSTSLLASRDWRYLVLKSRRDTAQASLYLIDTQTDKLTRFDTGTGDFELVGWYGHGFIYSVTRPTTSIWQSGRQSLKSYDAERGELNQIDQTQAEGSATSHAYQTFNNFYILDNLVTYNVTWYATGMDLASKKSSIRAATPTGKDKKDYQTFDANNLSYFAASLYEPQEVYYAAYENNGKVSFYEFEDKKVTLASGIDQSDFSKTYPTYLISPSSSKAFWSDFRDGKNTLFTGSSSDLSGKKQIATLSDYAPYGWFSDNYLLVSKNSSELFITTEKNLSAQKPPLKVTDYYKPAQTFSGYGYGYGGL